MGEVGALILMSAKTLNRWLLGETLDYLVYLVDTL